MRSKRFIRLSSILLVVTLCAACGGQAAPRAKEAEKPAAAPGTVATHAGDAPAAPAPFPDPPRGPHKIAIEKGSPSGVSTAFPCSCISNVQAVVNLAGVIDMEHPRTEQWEEKERLLLFGGPQEEHADLVRLASPVLFLDADGPPVLTIHGTKDPNVPLHHSTFLHEKLKGSGVSSEIRLLEGKGHWLVQYPAMPVEPEVKALTLACFQKHLAQ